MIDAVQTKAAKLIERLKDEGYKPRSYSGRGMMGKHCVAISGDLDKYEVGAAVGSGFSAPQQDAMGMGIVLYWPAYEWPEEK